VPLRVPRREPWAVSDDWGLFEYQDNHLSRMKKNPAAVALGSIKSEKKAKASRENEKKGGWPKSRQRKKKI